MLWFLSPDDVLAYYTIDLEISILSSFCHRKFSIYYNICFKFALDCSLLLCGDF